MSSLHAQIQDLSDSLQQMSMRLSRVEESLISPHDYFSKSYFNEMARTLSVPGMRFVGEKMQHSVHSYLWLFIHVITLLVSYVYIKEEYDNWQSSPVIRSLSNNMTYFEEIPFPAVTICVPYSFQSDYDFLGYLEKCVTCNSTEEEDDYCFYNDRCDKEEIETLAVASVHCQFQSTRNISESPATVFSRDVNTSIDGELFSTYAKKVLPPCDFLIKQQINENNEYSFVCAKDGIQQLFLAYGIYGICTTFNGVRHEDIYKENVVLPIPLQHIPVDQRYMGESFTPENMMYSNGSNSTIPVYISDDDYITYFISKRKNQMYQNVCNVFSHNEVASVTLHNPADIPIFQEMEDTIKTGYYYYIKVTPKLEITKKDLIRFSPLKRGCYYSHERELSMFKRYTQRNCEAECESNCSSQICNCVPRNLPRQNISTRVCVTECKTTGCYCDCLPDCVSLSYEFESTKERKDTNGTGIIYVYYESKNFYPMIRVGINDLADFMAYSFGILGTFNGFSIMVVFELLYFITLRLWSSIKTYLSQNMYEQI